MQQVVSSLYDISVLADQFSSQLVLAGLVDRCVYISKPPIQRTTGVVMADADAPPDCFTVQDFVLVCSNCSIATASMGLPTAPFIRSLPPMPPASLTGPQFAAAEIAGLGWSPWVYNQQQYLAKRAAATPPRLCYTLKLASPSTASTSMPANNDSCTISKGAANPVVVLAFQRQLFDYSTQRAIPFIDDDGWLISDPGAIHKVQWLLPHEPSILAAPSHGATGTVPIEGAGPTSGEVTAGTRDAIAANASLAWCLLVFFDSGVALCQMETARSSGLWEEGQTHHPFSDVAEIGGGFTAARVVWYVPGSFNTASVCPIDWHLALGSCHEVAPSPHDVICNQQVMVFMNGAVGGSKAQCPSTYRMSTLGSSLFLLPASAIVVSYPANHVRSIDWRRTRTNALLAVSVWCQFRAAGAEDSSTDTQVDIYDVCITNPASIAIGKLLHAAPATHDPHYNSPFNPHLSHQGQGVAAAFTSTAIATPTTAEGVGSPTARGERPVMFPLIKAEPSGTKIKTASISDDTTALLADGPLSCIWGLHKTALAPLWEERTKSELGYSRTHSHASRRQHAIDGGGDSTMAQPVAAPDIPASSEGSFLVQVVPHTGCTHETGGDRLKVIEVNRLTGALYFHAYPFSESSVSAGRGASPAVASGQGSSTRGGGVFNPIALSAFVAKFGPIRQLHVLPQSTSSRAVGDMLGGSVTRYATRQGGLNSSSGHSTQTHLVQLSSGNTLVGSPARSTTDDGFDDITSSFCNVIDKAHHLDAAADSQWLAPMSSMNHGVLERHAARCRQSIRLVVVADGGAVAQASVPINGEVLPATIEHIFHFGTPLGDQKKDNGLGSASDGESQVPSQPRPPQVVDISRGVELKDFSTIAPAQSPTPPSSVSYTSSKILGNLPMVAVLFSSANIAHSDDETYSRDGGALVQVYHTDTEGMHCQPLLCHTVRRRRDVTCLKVPTVMLEQHLTPTGDAIQTQPAAPVGPQPLSIYKDDVISFMHQNCPTMVPRVDLLLNAVKGDAAKLLKNLKLKHGVPVDEESPQPAPAPPPLEAQSQRPVEAPKCGTSSLPLGSPKYVSLALVTAQPDSAVSRYGGSTRNAPDPKLLLLMVFDERHQLWGAAEIICNLNPKTSYFTKDLFSLAPIPANLAPIQTPTSSASTHHNPRTASESSANDRRSTASSAATAFEAQLASWGRSLAAYPAIPALYSGLNLLMNSYTSTSPTSNSYTRVTSVPSLPEAERLLRCLSQCGQECVSDRDSALLLQRHSTTNVPVVASWVPTQAQTSKAFMPIARYQAHTNTATLYAKAAAASELRNTGEGCWWEAVVQVTTGASSALMAFECPQMAAGPGSVPPRSDVLVYKGPTVVTVVVLFAEVLLIFQLDPGRALESGVVSSKSTSARFELVFAQAGVGAMFVLPAAAKSSIAKGKPIGGSNLAKPSLLVVTSNLPTGLATIGTESLSAPVTFAVDLASPLDGSQGVGSFALTGTLQSVSVNADDGGPPKPLSLLDVSCIIGYPITRVEVLASPHRLSKWRLGNTIRAAGGESSRALSNKDIEGFKHTLRMAPELSIAAMCVLRPPPKTKRLHAGSLRSLVLVGGSPASDQPEAEPSIPLFVAALELVLTAPYTVGGSNQGATSALAESANIATALSGPYPEAAELHKGLLSMFFDARWPSLLRCLCHLVQANRKHSNSMVAAALKALRDAADNNGPTFGSPAFSPTIEDPLPYLKELLSLPITNVRCPNEEAISSIVNHFMSTSAVYGSPTGASGGGFTSAVDLRARVEVISPELAMPLYASSDRKHASLMAIIGTSAPEIAMSGPLQLLPEVLDGMGQAGAVVSEAAALEATSSEEGDSSTGSAVEREVLKFLAGHLGLRITPSAAAAQLLASSALSSSEPMSPSSPKADPHGFSQTATAATTTTTTTTTAAVTCMPPVGGILTIQATTTLESLCVAAAETLTSSTIDGLTSGQQLDVFVALETIRTMLGQYGKMDEGSKRLLTLWRQREVNKRFGASSSTFSAVSITSSSMCWAMLSDAQEQLVEAINPTSWDECVSSGLPLWTKSLLTLRRITEAIGKGLYGAARDIKACALMYVLSKKVPTLMSFAKNSNDMRLHDFLSRDFSQKINRKAAVANAYAAVSKGSLHYGAAFFVLGQDAISAAMGVVQRTGDWMLGLLIIRLGYDDDPARIEQYLEFLEGSPDIHLGPWERCALRWRIGDHIQALRELHKGDGKAGPAFTAEATQSSIQAPSGTKVGSEASEVLQFLQHCCGGVTVLSRTKKEDILPLYVRARLCLSSARHYAKNGLIASASRQYLCLWVVLDRIRSGVADGSLMGTYKREADEAAAKVKAAEEAAKLPPPSTKIQANFNTGQLAMFGMDSDDEDGDTAPPPPPLQPEAPPQLNASSSDSEGGSDSSELEESDEESDEEELPPPTLKPRPAPTFDVPAKEAWLAAVGVSIPMLLLEVRTYLASYLGMVATKRDGSPSSPTSSGGAPSRGPVAYDAYGMPLVARGAAGADTSSHLRHLLGNLLALAKGFESPPSGTSKEILLQYLKGVAEACPQCQDHDTRSLVNPVLLWTLSSFACAGRLEALAAALCIVTVPLEEPLDSVGDPSLADGHGSLQRRHSHHTSHVPLPKASTAGTFLKQLATATTVLRNEAYQHFVHLNDLLQSGAIAGPSVRYGDSRRPWGGRARHADDAEDVYRFVMVHASQCIRSFVAMRTIPTHDILVTWLLLQSTLEYVTMTDALSAKRAYITGKHLREHSDADTEAEERLAATATAANASLASSSYWSLKTGLVPKVDEIPAFTALRWSLTLLLKLVMGALERDVELQRQAHQCMIEGSPSASATTTDLVGPRTAEALSHVARAFCAFGLIGAVRLPATVLWPLQAPISSYTQSSLQAQMLQECGANKALVLIVEAIGNHRQSLEEHDSILSLNGVAGPHDTSLMQALAAPVSLPLPPSSSVDVRSPTSDVNGLPVVNLRRCGESAVSGANALEDVAWLYSLTRHTHAALREAQIQVAVRCAADAPQVTLLPMLSGDPRSSGLESRKEALASVADDMKAAPHNAGSSGTTPMANASTSSRQGSVVTAGGRSASTSSTVYGRSSGIARERTQFVADGHGVTAISVDRSSFDNLVVANVNSLICMHGMRDHFLSDGDADLQKRSQFLRENATAQFATSFRPDREGYGGWSHTHGTPSKFGSALSSAIVGSVGTKGPITFGSSLATSAHSNVDEGNTSNLVNTSSLSSHPYLPIYIASSSAGRCSLYQYGNDDRLAHFNDNCCGQLSYIGFSPHGDNLVLAGARGTIALWKFGALPAPFRLLPMHFTESAAEARFIDGHNSVVAVVGTDGNGGLHQHGSSNSSKLPFGAFSSGHPSESAAKGKLSIIDFALPHPHGLAATIELPIARPTSILHDSVNSPTVVGAIDATGSIALFDLRAGRLMPPELTPYLDLGQLAVHQHRKPASSRDQAAAQNKVTTVATCEDKQLMAIGTLHGDVAIYSTRGMWGGGGGTVYSGQQPSQSVSAGSQGACYGKRQLEPVMATSTSLGRRPAAGGTSASVIDVLFTPSSVVYATGEGKVFGSPIISSVVRQLY